MVLDFGRKYKNARETKRLVLAQSRSSLVCLFFFLLQKRGLPSKSVHLTGGTRTALKVLRGRFVVLKIDVVER